ncbi:PREDICTED: uncharacterized protein LOC105581270 isoform X8 [Cercocebus atys]|uniref:uncharacterized protein LOC105581270 isoform X8 n=1 Tax=Cercocebus atys TaxID=9531 RepID=UPI0005F4887D|nr:PREDICTED: uncharacterized protein LOC105581270 isoform X8 [Cercocebus atys]
MLEAKDFSPSTHPRPWARTEVESAERGARRGLLRGPRKPLSASPRGLVSDIPVGASPSRPRGTTRAVTPTVKVGGSIFEVSKTMNPLEGTNSGHSNSRCHSWSTCHVPGGAKCSACARMCSMAMNQV